MESHSELRLDHHNRIAAPGFNPVWGSGTSTEPYDLTYQDGPDFTSSSSKVSSPHRNVRHLGPPYTSRGRISKDRRTVSAPVQLRQSNPIKARLSPTQQSQRKREQLPDDVDMSETVAPTNLEAQSYGIPGAFPIEVEPVRSTTEGFRTPTRKIPSSSRTSPSSGISPWNRKSPNSNINNHPSPPRSPPVLANTADKLTAAEIHAGLRKQFMEPLTFKDAPGALYILQHPQNPSLLKIGSTKRADFSARLREHRWGCGFDPIIVHEPTATVKYCLRVERLIHRDLAQYNKPWKCEHKGLKNGAETSTHEEWFLVSQELAIQTVRKWEAFVRREKPYNWIGRLSVVWTYLMAKRRLVLSAGGGHLTHDARHEQWAALFAPPTTEEYITAYWQEAQSILKITSAHLLELYRHMRRFHWQYIAVSNSLFILVYIRGNLALCAFLFVLGCVWLSPGPSLRRQRSRKLT